MLSKIYIYEPTTYQSIQWMVLHVHNSPTQNNPSVFQLQQILTPTSILLAIQYIEGIMSFNLDLKVEVQDKSLQSPRQTSTAPNKKRHANRGYEVPELNNFMRTYRKEIELPVNYETSIFLTKTPQRCIAHNNVITLYCVQDKKPLCIQCMYQAFAHKKHQVIPISKANKELKTQLVQLMRNLVQGVLPDLDTLIIQNQTELSKVEKEMGEFIMKVTKFYNDLNSFIIAKKNQQLKYYQQLWNKLRFTYSSFASEITKTKQFATDKIRQIEERKAGQHLLYNYNIAALISKVKDIIPLKIVNYQQQEIKGVYGRMEEAKLQLGEALSFPYTICGQWKIADKVEKDNTRGMTERRMWFHKKQELVTVATAQKKFTPVKSSASPRFSHNAKQKSNLTVHKKGNPTQQKLFQSGHFNLNQPSLDTPRSHIFLHSPKQQDRKLKFFRNAKKSGSMERSPKKENSEAKYETGFAVQKPQ